ncbi:extracellular calcium-sensing receptor-like [Diretmus argenteus]
MDGDYIIGGVFSIHNYMHTVKHNYTSIPEPLRCTGSVDGRELRFSRAMVFAIEEINNSTELLPGVRLGYRIHDSCASVPVAVQAAFQLTNGVQPAFDTGETCSQSGTVTAVVGESGSTPSISTSRIIGPFDIPQVSHYATCACLSDKQQYPTFFRTIPSDRFQALALAKLVKHFGWTWIGAVRSDSDYGNNGMAAFLHAARKEGICVEYSESFYRTHPRSRFQRVADVIRGSTAMVVVAFVSSGDIRLLLEELGRQPSPPRQWVGSEAWVTDPNLLRFSFCAGTIGVGIPQSVIPGLREFLLDLSPAKVAGSQVLTEFWESAFNCRLGRSADGAEETVCDGTEDMQKLQSPYTDTSQLRITNMVYKAVYAIAHAMLGWLISRGDESAYRSEIDLLLTWCSRNNLELNALKTVELIVDFRRNPAPPPPIILGGTPVATVESCRFLGVTVSQDLKWGPNIDTLTKKAQKRLFFLRQLRKFHLPRTLLVNFYTAIIESIITLAITVLGQLKRVNFSRNGYQVSFDANGDPLALYELVNWQRSESGSTEIVTVGYYDASLPAGQEFQTNRNLTWAQGGTQVPVSVCSESCPPGTRKVLQKGKPVCCYDCIPCPEGEISNTTDSPDCLPCPEEFWPNADRDVCLPKPIEFLSFHEALGIILATFSVGGACLAVVTATVFFRHRASAIVRANNSELSFLLLFSLALCFLCSLTFIGPPSDWSCMLRHTAFGITFVLCISCVLGKTIVVLMAFRATLPGSNVMKWFGPPQQRMTVASFTFIQALICTLWLVLNPPFPIKNLTTYKERLILECALGSAIGFWAVLGYIGLLAVLCFALAVLARKLPDNFNEAKLITFSMLIFCAVWITFIPAYVSSPGKFTVAVEIFAMLASSFALILCIFAQKCFIILFRPEKNTKKHLMSKNPSD